MDVETDVAVQYLECLVSLMAVMSKNQTTTYCGMMGSARAT